MNARKSPRFIPLLAVAALLSACGGGGGHKASVTKPTASITYLQGAGLVVGAGTPPLRPTISGDVTGNFAISPPLPPGLTIDPDLGHIYGVPTAPAPTTTYRVEASSPEGRITTTVTFTVRDVITRISYSPDSWNLAQNVPLAENITPGNSGGAVVSWSIDRALPAGLDFDTSSGTISGTPTAASPQTNYLVTATNSGGASSATLTITVQAALSTNLVRMAGDTTVEQNGGWLEVLDRASGAPLSQIELPAGMRWWQLASDGSYVVTATDTRLTAWSPAGAALFTKVADYGQAHAFAAASELRLAAGPAGANTLEIIPVPAGVASLVATYPGQFLSWSDDGEQFTVTSGSVESEILLQPALAQARMQRQH